MVAKFSAYGPFLPLEASDLLKKAALRKMELSAAVVRHMR